jgi:hypothetical protein
MTWDLLLGAAMTQNPYSPQDQQQSSQQVPPSAGQPMNVYQAPGNYGGVYPGSREARPSWPTTVGMISLCVAGLFGLMTIGGLVINAAGGTAQQREMMENMPAWFKTHQWLAGLFTILTYVVLAIGGAMLLKRRRAARTLHTVYALMGILVAISGLIVTVTMMNYMSLPRNAPSQARVIIKTSMAIGAIFGMAFALAYPTFLLIWFTRPKVARDIQTWVK